MLSMSEPPRCTSPEVEQTSLIPSKTESIVTSNVPPPKSKTRIFLSSSNFYPIINARLAAVGSLIILNTFSPAIVPAAFVASR